jgi:hypothetical protein
MFAAFSLAAISIAPFPPRVPFCAETDETSPAPMETAQSKRMKVHQCEKCFYQRYHQLFRW